jgi:hypothetical protein
MSVQFTHVPMWVQFQNIPFYLLTKSLAWELGWEIGTTLMIDNNSRGGMNDKFLRARIQIPLYAALRKKITLEDEITGEEVKVKICYERLPNFCLFCGYIGHMEARCDLPTADRKIKFSMDMRVQPVHFQDPRAWFLPEAMGQAQAQPVPTAPWRASKPTPAVTHHGVIAQVAVDVAKLNVNDDNNSPAAVDNDKGEPMALMATATIEAEADKADADMVDTANNTANAVKLKAKNKEGESVQEELPIMLEPCASDASSNTKKVKRWKRTERGAREVQNIIDTSLVPLQHRGGKEGVLVSRTRPREQQKDSDMEPARKKGLFEVPPLAVCLGEEGLRKLKEAEMTRTNKESAEEGNTTEEERQKNKEEEVEKAATDPGATGKLSGASVSARQGP